MVWREEEAGSAADRIELMEMNSAVKCSHLFLKKFLPSSFSTLPPGWMFKRFNFCHHYYYFDSLKMHFFMPSGDLSSRWKGSTVKLRGDALLFATFTLTYHDKGPVAKVVNGAEEPELVQEKVGSCHGALIWKGRTNPVMNQSINRWIDSLGSDWCKRSQVKRCST